MLCIVCKPNGGILIGISKCGKDDEAVGEGKTRSVMHFVPWSCRTRSIDDALSRGFVKGELSRQRKTDRLHGLKMAKRKSKLQTPPNRNGKSCWVKALNGQNVQALFGDRANLDRKRNRGW